MPRRPFPQILLLAAVALATIGQPIAARTPRLTPAETPARELAEGTSRVAEGAFLFRPPEVGGQARPLIVLFHGAGMSARRMLDGMIPEARRCRCLLLAIGSHETTWDLVTAMRQARGRDGPARLDSLFGPDADRVERALAAVLRSPSVDRRRVISLGFSDGASYALSLALANPHLMRGVVAIAPGFHVEPGTIDPSQRLFIAHSPEDNVLSFAASRDRIAGSLRNAGFDPVFHSYRGGHVADPAVVARGIDHVLGAPPGQQAD